MKSLSESEMVLFLMSSTDRRSVPRVIRSLGIPADVFYRTAQRVKVPLGRPQWSSRISGANAYQVLLALRREQRLNTHAEKIFSRVFDMRMRLREHESRIEDSERERRRQATTSTSSNKSEDLIPFNLVNLAAALIDLSLELGEKAYNKLKMADSESPQVGLVLPQEVTLLAELYLLWLDNGDNDMPVDARVRAHYTALAQMPPACTIEREAMAWIKIQLSSMTEAEIKLGVSVAAEKLGDNHLWADTHSANLTDFLHYKKGLL